jgi:putative flavoprotein involved in K+ transport
VYTDVAHAVGRVWGLGLGHKPKDPEPWERELRNMWKPVAVDGMWSQGGNLAQNRHYSRYLALQLAARYLGIETKVYGIPQSTIRPAPALNNKDKQREC